MSELFQTPEPVAIRDSVVPVRMSDAERWVVEQLQEGFGFKSRADVFRKALGMLIDSTEGKAAIAKASKSKPKRAK